MTAESPGASASQPPPTAATDQAEGAPPDPFTDADGESAPAAEGSPHGGPVHVEALLADLERVTNERESHLQDLQRLTAEFANFRKQAGRRHQEIIDQAAIGLVEKLLPVLDACEAALVQGATDVAPIQSSLLEVLNREGLTPIVEPGDVFDPNHHEAVIHEDGDGAEPVVAEVLRSGYLWNGRTLRPAMVKVRG